MEWDSVAADVTAYPCAIQKKTTMKKHPIILILTLAI